MLFTGALGEKKGFIMTFRNTSCTSLKNCRMESSLLPSCRSKNLICAAVTKADTCTASFAWQKLDYWADNTCLAA